MVFHINKKFKSLWEFKLFKGTFKLLWLQSEPIILIRGVDAYSYVCVCACTVVQLYVLTDLDKPQAATWTFILFLFCLSKTFQCKDKWQNNKRFCYF